jgi:hypothetical protein
MVDAGKQCDSPYSLRTPHSPRLRVTISSARPRDVRLPVAFVLLLSDVAVSLDCSVLRPWYHLYIEQSKQELYIRP